jgi:hypothetical protein
MPAYQFKLSGEIDISKNLDEQHACLSRVKHLVESVQSQSLSEQSLQALASATNLRIDVKMVSRPAKVKSDEAAG